MMILSVDLGKFNTVFCFYNTRTRKHRFETIATKRSHVEQQLSSEQIGLVLMEACGPSGWISEVCHEKKLQTIVCSTNDESWSWENTRRKTDRDDALKLARMAMLESLTPVHVPKPEIRERRAIIKYRKAHPHNDRHRRRAVAAGGASSGVRNEIELGEPARAVMPAKRCENAVRQQAALPNSGTGLRLQGSGLLLWIASMRHVLPQHVVQCILLSCSNSKIRNIEASES